MPKPTLRVVPPTAKIRKVTPRRPKNGEVRTREYLTEREVEQLIEGCRDNRRSHRDQTMILLAFRHGLRASELCDLQWTQVDFNHATLALTRVKHGTPSTHPLTGRELRALRRLHRETESKSPFLFLSERGSPMTVSAALHQGRNLSLKHGAPKMRPNQLSRQSPSRGSAPPCFLLEF